MGKSVTRSRKTATVQASSPAFQPMASPHFRANPRKSASQASRSLKGDQTNLSQTSSVTREQQIHAEDDAGIEERESEDFLHEVILALDLKNKDTIGCCYYVASDERLYFMGDIKLADMSVVGACK